MMIKILTTTLPLLLFSNQFGSTLGFCPLPAIGFDCAAELADIDQKCACYAFCPDTIIGDSFTSLGCCEDIISCPICATGIIKHCPASAKGQDHVDAINQAASTSTTTGNGCDAVIAEGKKQFPNCDKEFYYKCNNNYYCSDRANNPCTVSFDGGLYECNNPAHPDAQSLDLSGNSAECKGCSGSCISQSGVDHCCESGIIVGGTCTGGWKDGKAPTGLGDGIFTGVQSTTSSASTFMTWVGTSFMLAMGVLYAVV